MNWHFEVLSSAIKPHKDFFNWHYFPPLLDRLFYVLTACFGIRVLICSAMWAAQQQAEESFSCFGIFTKVVV